MLTFTPITEHKRGTLASLLTQSYAAMRAVDPGFWKEESPKWDCVDREAFDNPDTIGKCTFVTCLDGQVIGFGSFDPRQAPEVGVVGHNCILLEFRGRGFGKAQVQEIVQRLAERGIRKAAVSTADHPFFIPAQRMYTACGFRETRRHVPDPERGLRVIEYEMELQALSADSGQAP